MTGLRSWIAVDQGLVPARQHGLGRCVTPRLRRRSPRPRAQPRVPQEPSHTAREHQRGREDCAAVTVLREQDRHVPPRSGERSRHRARPPVFVDGSGRRPALVARSLTGIAVVSLGYMLILSVGLLGGFAPGELLPRRGAAGAQAGADGGRTPNLGVAGAVQASGTASPTPRAQDPKPGTHRIPLPVAVVPAPRRPIPAPTSSPPAPSPSTLSPTLSATTTVATATHGRSADAPGHTKHPPPHQ